MDKESKEYSKGKVLFVDDDDFNLKAIMAKVKHLPFTKFFASSGQRALEIMSKEDNISVIVTDLSMPEMNGIELLEIVNQTYPNTIKIILSMHSEVPTILALINKLKIQSYIVKPWKYEKDFLPAIRKALDQYNKIILQKEKNKNLLVQNRKLGIEKEVLSKEKEEIRLLTEKLKVETLNKTKLLSFFIHEVKPYLNESALILKQLEKTNNPAVRETVQKLNERGFTLTGNLNKLEQALNQEGVRKNYKILIVDDSSENRRVIASIIQKNTKYKVILAKNGMDVLNMVATNKTNEIGLILLDVMMPLIDGYELAKRLKELEGTKDIPIVFASALNDESSRKKALENGGLDYLYKPIDKTELISKIEKYIKKSY